jgi:hypothetical protein
MKLDIKSLHSIILLYLWIVLGACMLIWMDLSDQTRLIIFCLTIVVLVWNRVDSRTKAYKLRVQGPGNTEFNLSTGNKREHD